MKEKWNTIHFATTIAPTIFLLLQVWFGVFQLPGQFKQMNETFEQRFTKLETSIEGLKDALISGLISRPQPPENP